LNGIPNFTAKSEINVLDWIDEETLAVGTLDNTLYILNSVNGTVISKYTTNSNIKTLKYLATSGTLAAFLYNGDIMTLSRDFIKEK